MAECRARREAFRMGWGGLSDVRAGGTLPAFILCVAPCWRAGFWATGTVLCLGETHWVPLLFGDFFQRHSHIQL